MKRRFAFSFSLGAALVLASNGAGCGTHIAVVPPPKKVVPPPAAPPPRPQYVVSHQRLQKLGIDLGGHVGLIDGTTRVEVDETGKLVGVKVSPFPIQRTMLIPAGSGGGVLFLSPSGYRAPSFLGDLKPAFPSASLRSVSFGPKMALVQADDGQRFMVDLGDGAGTRRRVEPTGGFEYAATNDGFAGALVEGGFLFSSSDGKTWSDVSSKLDGPAVSIVSDADAVYVTTEAQSSFRIDRKGVSRGDVPSPPQRSPLLTTKNEPLLDLAMEVGAPVDDAPVPTKAMVPDAGAVYTIDLASGELIDFQRGFLPPDLPCQAHRFSNEMLVVCARGDRAVIASGPIGKKLEIEHRFSGNGSFVRGADDALIFTAPCNGLAAKPGKICIRATGDAAADAEKSEGRWIDLDGSQLFADAPTGPILAYVPVPNDALAVVGGEGGGIVDLRSGERSRLAPEDMAKLAPVFQRSTPSVLYHSFELGADGSIRGFDAAGVGVRISERGKSVEKSPFAFNGVKTNGRFALAAAPTGVWQSEDFGMTFTEVAPPPTGASKATVEACSETGCRMGTWLRVGWDARSPESSPRKETPPPPHVASMGSVDPAPLPFLSCKSTAPSVKQTAARAGEPVPGFGGESIQATETGVYQASYPRRIIANRTPADSASLRAFITGHAASFGVDGMPLLGPDTDRRVSWIEAFDPKAVTRHASIKLAALRSDLGAQSAADFGANTESGTALPVLGEKGGLFLFGQLGPALWVRDTRAIPIMLPENLASATFLSFVERSDSLFALLVDTDGRTAVWSISSPARELWHIAPQPADEDVDLSDSLAIASDGSFAVIRVPSSTPPTVESPAFLLRQGRPPIALAPWSTLTQADAPECKGDDGVRAILQTQLPWIGLEGSKSTDASDVHLMRVRWSETRVCLEAAEVDGPTLETPDGGSNPSWVTASFGGKDAGAGLVLMTQGAELRQPRACTLVASPATR